MKQIETQDIDGKLCEVELTTTWRVTRCGTADKQFDCLGKAQDYLEGCLPSDGFAIEKHISHRIISPTTGPFAEDGGADEPCKEDIEAMEGLD